MALTPDDAERGRGCGVGHDRRRPRIHVDEYENTFWSWAHPFIRQLGDCYNSCPGSDDRRLLSLRVRGNDVHYVAGP